jgi:hypothetical protein
MHFSFLHRRSTEPSGYERDYHLWTKGQASALREQRLGEIDWENVAEEIESLGRLDKRAIASDLNVVLLHLLKLAFQPGAAKRGWRSSVIEHRRRIAQLIDDSPSLRAYPAEVLSDEYRVARAKAADETGLPEESLPPTCPFSIAQILDPDFWPSSAES